MKGNLKIGTFFNIPVMIHWSFGMLVLFVIYIGLTNQLSIHEILAFGLYVIILFICVVLHEYGHALMARKYGVGTRDIILSPIGGVARLEKIPEEPYKELLIAIAGPMVNVVIAIVLSIITLIIFSGGILPSAENLELLKYPSEFIRFVIVMNIALFIFNLIPAFPMDGGRIFRSLLAMKWGRVKATRVAAIVGRILAIGFVITGVAIGNLLLSIIGVFIYMTAGSEQRAIDIAAALKNSVASDIMNNNYTYLHIGEKMEEPVDIYKRGGEKNFLVFDSLGHISGSLPEIFIIDAIKEGELDAPIGSKMSNAVGAVSHHTSLLEVYEMMQKNDIPIVAVKKDDEIIGVLDRYILSNFIEIRSKT